MARPKVSKRATARNALADGAALQDWRRDRLARAVCVEPLFRRRVRVLLASGLLVFSAAGTGTSVATEPDQGAEGVSPPGQTDPAPLPAPPASPSEPAPSPGEGGDAAPFEGAPEPAEPAPSPGEGGDAPFEDAPAPADPGVEASPDTNAEGEPLQSEPLRSEPLQSEPLEGEPLEGEPLDDRYGRLVLSEPEAPALPVVDEPPTLPADPSEALPLEAPPPAVPTPGEPLPPHPIPMPELMPTTGEGREATRRHTAADRHNRRAATRNAAERRAAKRRAARRDSAQRVMAPESAPRAEPAPEATPVPQAAVGAAESVASHPARPPRGIPRFHVVRRGESLWSIAAELLERGASTVAIAREVRRLWALNAKRIGTGDPNLLVVGVKLRLR